MEQASRHRANARSFCVCCKKDKLKDVFRRESGSWGTTTNTFFCGHKVTRKTPHLFCIWLVSFSNFYTLAKSLGDGTAQRSSDSASPLFWLTQIHRDSNANASHLLSPYFWAITLDNKLAKKKERKKYQRIAFCCFLLLSWIMPNCKNLISLHSLHSGDPVVAPSVGNPGKARCACDVFVCFSSLESNNLIDAN